MKLLFNEKVNTGLVFVVLILSGPFFFSGCMDSEGNDLLIKKNNMTQNKNQQSAKVKGFKINIEESTLENKNFRKVLYTSQHNQLVLMSLKPKEEIGEEIHADTDQFFRFEGGNGKCIINETEYQIKDGDAIVIPAGAKHNVINTDAVKELKMYTIYSPPHHKDGIVHKTKEEAVAKEEEFDGITSEGY